MPGSGLQAHENAGGHLIEKHIGETDAELLNRLSREPKITGASSFPDRTTAEKAVSEAIDANQVQIKNFLSGKNPSFKLEYDTQNYVGNIISKGQTTSMRTSKVTVILRRDPSMATGYRIQTGFPSK